MVFEQAVMDAYVRVSRVAGREGESFISPDVQRRQIAGWAELRGVRLAAWHEDLDVSGGRTADERPGLSAVMERIRSGQTGGVAVAKLDRLSRLGLLDSLKLIEEIRAAGGTFAALDLGVDPTTDGGEIALNVMLTLAGQQRRRIAEGWRVAQAQAVERGVYIASKAPTGYGREDGRLVPNGHARAISDLFTMRAGGASWRECCAFLTMRGVIGPWGKSFWRTDAVQGLISNRAYLGESRFGELVNSAAHHPLTDEETFRRAQRAPSPPVSRSGEGALLTGIIRCAGCRYLLKPSTRTHRGEKTRIYECGKHHASGNVPLPRLCSGAPLSPTSWSGGSPSWASPSSWLGRSTHRRGTSY